MRYKFLEMVLDTGENFLPQTDDQSVGGPVVDDSNDEISYGDDGGDGNRG